MRFKHFDATERDAIPDFFGHSAYYRPVDSLSHKVPIQELAAIIRVKATQREGQRLLDGFDLVQNALFASAPDCPLFGPPGGDIDAIYRKCLYSWPYHGNRRGMIALSRLKHGRLAASHMCLIGSITAGLL